MTTADGSSGKGKEPIPASPTWPQTKDKFVKWFWKGSNGNDLVKELNKSTSHGDNYIRREKDRPTVYCIVLNDDKLILGKTAETKKVPWKLCKVGFTQVPTATGSNNRMEDIKKDIDRKYAKTGREAKASVLLVLPIGAVDTTAYLGTEKRIREAVGLPIVKTMAKELFLSCSTEWVLTTQGFLDMIRAKIDGLKGTGEPIDVFKDYKFTIPKPLKLSVKEGQLIIANQ